MGNLTQNVIFLDVYIFYFKKHSSLSIAIKAETGITNFQQRCWFSKRSFMFSVAVESVAELDPPDPEPVLVGDGVGRAEDALRLGRPADAADLLGDLGGVEDEALGQGGEGELEVLVGVGAVGEGGVRELDGVGDDGGGGVRGGVDGDGEGGGGEAEDGDEDGGEGLEGKEVVGKMRM